MKQYVQINQSYSTAYRDHSGLQFLANVLNCYKILKNFYSTDFSTD